MYCGPRESAAKAPASESPSPLPGAGSRDESRGLRWFAFLVVLAVCCIAMIGACSFAQSIPAKKIDAGPPKIIIDTDIGDDVDDAFAVALALQSVEFKIVGITTAWGDTKLRARLLDRLLKEVGRSDIPVAVGIEKHRPGDAIFSQARWTEAGPAAKEHPAAVDFLLEQVRSQPGEITLVAIAPLTNIGAAIDRDPAAFKKLKRVVMMGGSVYRGYDDLGEGNRPPDREYNIAMDVQAAQKLFDSGVPLYVMPLDSTQLKLDEVKRTLVFTQSTPLTDALTLLYQQWTRGTNRQTPTLFDVMPVAFAIAPQLCPTRRLRLRVDDQGYTRPEPGTPNTEVCVASDPTRFFEFVLPRLVKPNPPTTAR
jgi:inosine-uridine nucleoside N-ribohydrolase